MNNVQSLVKTHAQQEGINKLGMHLEVSAQLQIDKFVGGALFFYVAHGHDLIVLIYRDRDVDVLCTWLHA